MLPGIPGLLTSNKDSSKVADVEENKGKCDPSARIPVASVNTVKNSTKINVQSKNLSQIPIGHHDRNEERHPDKLLRPIAPKPVTIVCVPDISSVRETEIEVPVKQEVVSKNDENNVKIGNAGGSTKCEKDNEETSVLNQETSILKKTSSTGSSPPKISKKKPKQIRDLEKTLNCLLSDNEQVKDEKAFAFAQSYFLKVTETLHGKDDATYGEFMKTMNDFGVTIFDATELYKKVTKIFEKYPNLAEEFLAFLLPEQAMQCGKFMEYIMITKMSSFCRTLELYYSKQPSQLRKIYSSLAMLASNNKATLDDLRNTILPLLKNNSLLVNMFLELMPPEAPHASSLTDYESMDFSSVDIQNPKSENWFETVEVPPPVEDSMYGGEGCICPCHIPSEGKSRRRSAHCMSCGTKFIEGRVYIHSGSMLRPARVSFKEMRNKAIERLSVKNLKTRRKMDKNQAPPSSSKKNNSTKGDTASNVSGPSNKLSPPKTKRNAKGKTLSENQKKSNKSLSPKVSHSKKLNNEKKIPKPPRKRIKLLTNNLESSSSTSSPVKSHLVPPKKGVSQAGKLAGQVDAKTANKGGPQFSIDQTEKNHRTARLAARNMTFSSDSIQKSNRRQSSNTFKVKATKDAAADFLKKKPEEVSVKTKNSVSTSFNMSTSKDDSVGKLSSQGRSIADKSESKLTENACKVMSPNEGVQKEFDDTKKLSDDQISKLNASPSTVFQIKNDTISDLKMTIKITEPGSSSKEDIMPLKFPKECEMAENEQNVEESFSKDCKLVHSKNTDTSIELSLQCSHSFSDDSGSDHFSNSSEQERTTEICSRTESVLQNEGESMENKIIDLGKSVEINSSEDEKNILDSEDFQCSSSDLEVEENFQMDVEESCEEADDSCTSSQSDSNGDVLNEGNHCSDIKEVSGTEEPVCPPWTRDEDKIILRTFQSVNNSEHVFQKICHELPSRTAEEVRCRFQTLMTFLEKMSDV